MIAVILASGSLDRLYTGLSLLVSTAADGEPALGLATFGALEPFADALETVAALRAGGVAVAVASSSARPRLDRALARAGLAEAFAVSVAGDEVAHGKPAPDMFLAAAEQLGVPPAACAVVEDSGPGVAAGLAAGMRTVAILRAGVPAGALADAHAVLERLSADAVLGH